MIADLRRRFWGRFEQTARGRLACCRELVAGALPGWATQLAGELHALAGEASVLEYRVLAACARQAEAAARTWEKRTDFEGPAECGEALEAVEAELALLCRDRGAQGG